MGVPGFFAWILKNCGKNKIIEENINNELKKISLYIDCNCLIHPECFNVLNYYNNLNKKISAVKLRQYMFDRIKKYISYLIEVSNATNVYIAVDGVAPMAKINQQRKRRFKTAWEKEIRNEIAEKHNIKEAVNKWDNTCITPGTVFMEVLHKELESYVNDIKKLKNINIIYSSYHIEGEGEHKILQEIKNDTTDNIYIIYGLDADLLFLALGLSKLKTIYLFREEVELNKGLIKNNNINEITQKMVFVSIKNLKKSILNIFYDRCGIKKKYMINDFIFMCYLLGNDFLPHIPSMDIKNYGIDNLLWAYSVVHKIHKKCIVTKDITINMDVFELLIMELAFIEKKYFHKRPYNKIMPTDLDEYKKDLWRLENMFYFEAKDTICLGKGLETDWKKRYYIEYFEQPYNIQEICKQYLEGIKWVTEYYFKECCSWSWQYTYTHGPFMSDIYEYLIDINTIELEKNKPLTPQEQLLAVLPPSQYKLLEKKYQWYMINKKSPIIEYYPTKFKIDMINKDYLYNCIPMLPSIDRNKLINI